MADDLNRWPAQRLYDAGEAALADGDAKRAERIISILRGRATRLAAGLADSLEQGVAGAHRDSVEPSLIFEALGVMTVADARAANWPLAAELASVAGSTPATVKGRLERLHGATLLWNAFDDRWIAIVASLGQLTASAARSTTSRGLDYLISRLTGLSANAVGRRITRAHGKTLVRTIFSDAWPATRDPPPATRIKRKPDRPVGVSPETEPSKEARPGDLVDGRYALRKRLGEGGYGVAFEATDNRSSRMVVVKIAKYEGKDALDEELRLALELSHHNICRYHDGGYDSNRKRSFIVMEHGGTSLASRIHGGEEFSLQDGLRIASCAAAALDHAHDQRILHGDVSPHNILVDDAGRVRLTDFGVSRKARETARTGGHATLIATASGKQRVYCAPEVMLEEPVRRASDQYSLALVLCSLLEGQVFAARYRFERIDELSPAQNHAVRRALSLDHSQRFPSCMEFLTSLASTS